MCHTMEIYCFKLYPKLLFTKYFMQTKKKKKKIVGFRKTFFITLLLATHANVKLLLYFGQNWNRDSHSPHFFWSQHFFVQTP